MCSEWSEQTNQPNTKRQNIYSYVFRTPISSDLVHVLMIVFFFRFDLNGKHNGNVTPRQMATYIDNHSILIIMMYLYLDLNNVHLVQLRLYTHFTLNDQCNCADCGFFFSSFFSLACSFFSQFINTHSNFTSQFN